MATIAAKKKIVKKETPTFIRLVLKFEVKMRPLMKTSFVPSLEDRALAPSL